MMLIANGGTGIDMDAQAIATTGLIDTGVVTADLDFVVVVFADEDDSTYVPTASPSEPPSNGFLFSQVKLILQMYLHHFPRTFNGNYCRSTSR